MAKNRERDEALGLKEDFKQYSHEELMEEVFKARDPKTIDGVESAAKQRRQTQLLEKAGYKWVDVRELTPSKENFYHINDEEIEDLAAMIYTSKNTTPLTLRETKDGTEIVDGERRCRAHLLLGERYGETWYMVPARVFEYGSLTDEEAELILNTMNLGQRDMTPSERAKGFTIIGDLIRNDKSGRWGSGSTRELLAKHFGVSPRTAQMEMTIGKNLCKEGQELLDSKRIRKATAAVLAGLNEDNQHVIIDQIRQGLVNDDEIKEAVEDLKNEEKGTTAPRPRKPKTIDGEVKSATRALKRAFSIKERPDRVEVAKLKNMLEELSSYVKQLEDMADMPELDANGDVIPEDNGE